MIIPCSTPLQTTAAVVLRHLQQMSEGGMPQSFLGRLFDTLLKGYRHSENDNALCDYDT